MCKYLFKTCFLLLALMAGGTSSMAQRTWYNPMDGDSPYICGRAWNDETGKTYRRVPDRFQSSLPQGVWWLSGQSAGLSVRFKTDATDIQIRYSVTTKKFPEYPNMAPLDHSGIDLYAQDVHGREHWVGNHMKWQIKDTIQINFLDISVPKNIEGGRCSYEIYLSPYNTIDFLSIGVPDGAYFSFERESTEKPVVIYGSSIVQGASPSRPGLMWTNIVKREMGVPLVNMGFSGSARLEPEVFDMLSEIDASVFVLDPIPNSFNMKEKVQPMTVEGVKKLRAKSGAPILLVENYAAPDSIFRHANYENYVVGNMYYRKAFEQLKAEGVKNIYYLTAKEIGFTEDSMIEGTHPNDIGNMQYANAVEKKLRKILHLKKPKYKKK